VVHVADLWQSGGAGGEEIEKHRSSSITCLVDKKPYVFMGSSPLARGYLSACGFNKGYEERIEERDLRCPITQIKGRGLESWPKLHSRNHHEATR